VWGLLASKLLTSQRLRRLVPIAAIAGFACVMLLIALIAGAMLVLEQQQQTECGTQASTSATPISTTGSQAIPAALIPIYQQAATTYQLGPDGWAWLAAINEVETDFGRDLSLSSAGAEGWMQFEPGTWAAYGVDADHNGIKDPYNPDDAINGAANYLHTSGAPGNWQTAVYAYNHSGAYYTQVAGLEQSFTQPAGGASATLVDVADTTPTPATSPAPAIALHGAASTYGNDPAAGIVDHNDNNQPALQGASNDTPGIAVLDTQTLGGWWQINAPNGHSAILQQTDYGPSSATGLIVDINAVAARTIFHYPAGHFPTGRGSWTLHYLGQQRPANAATLAQGPTSPGAAGDPATATMASTACVACPDTAPAAAAVQLAAQVDPAGVPNEHGGPGFTAGPGTNYTVGEEPELAEHLDTLGRSLGIALTGISGYRSPTHSVAVGGFSDDPHTRGEASDTDGIQQVPEATLEQYGLTRPFDQLLPNGGHTDPAEANHIQLLGSAGAATLAVAAAPAGACQAGGALPMAPGDQARILPNGLAEAPADAPPAVQAMIAAGNQLIGLPYLYGGGHSTFSLAADQAGVDCSGAVSWLLHAGGFLNAPEDSTTLEGFDDPGSGLWVTVYASTVHTFMYVAGIRMDTSPQADDGAESQLGPRWRPAARSNAGFIARHPTGL
jgi:hypothetical protein